MSTETQDRTALVTGGGSGIGAAFALRLARRGMRSAILGRDQAKLERTADDIAAETDLRPLVVAADQQDEAAVGDAVNRVSEAFGRIDILFNNAAVYEFGTAADASMELWDKTMAINFRGPLLVARAVLPLQRQQGSGVIINNASTLGFRTVPGVATYACSKAALLMLTQCLALEEAEHGIRVLAICPGAVDTPIHKAEGTDREQLFERLAAIHPLQRVGTADEIAALAEHLVSDDASWMTGSVITIDGGVSLK
jgi:NAD(P)-dependent dehydrogenase (short-subunit alcohol dehydrogenase family)